MLNKLLLATLFGLCAGAAHAQTYPNHWPQVAKNDLDFVYNTLRADHPGAIDKQNPAFKKWMERGYVHASSAARKAASLDDAKRVLARYAGGFADGHLQVGFYQQSSMAQWPGMVIGRSGADYVVSGLAQDWPAPLPSVGAVLVSCDGRSPDTMMNEDILPGQFNLTTSDAVKGMFMNQLLYDNERAPHQYISCVFSEAGQRKDIALQWRGVNPAEHMRQWRVANPPLAKRSSISKLAPGKYWVHLPQFNPGPAQEAELKALIADVATLRSADLVVFDLRNNDGGNSQWGDDALANLYGAPYLDYLSARQAKQGKQEYAEYRVSKANLAYEEQSLATLSRQFGADSPAVRRSADLAARMRRALDAGVPFLRHSPETAQPPLPATAPAALSTARAVLVTDSNCVSSCLDFADAILRLPNVLHLGQTTGADTLFMEVRLVDLPSKLGRLGVAQKVYRNRLRANNQAWVPSLHYPGRINDTDKLKAWVLEKAR